MEYPDLETKNLLIKLKPLVKPNSISTFNKYVRDYLTKTKARRIISKKQKKSGRGQPKPKKTISQIYEDLKNSVCQEINEEVNTHVDENMSCSDIVQIILKMTAEKNVHRYILLVSKEIIDKSSNLVNKSIYKSNVFI